MAAKAVVKGWKRNQVDGSADQLAEAVGKAFKNEEKARDVIDQLSPSSGPNIVLKDGSWSKNDKKLQRKMANIDRKATADARIRMEKIIAGLLPVPLSYEDSDQSPVKGDKAQYLRSQWGGKMDYRPECEEIWYLSDWLHSIYMGDMEMFLEELEGKSEDEVQKLMKMRETMMNVGVLFHVIEGATVFSEGDHMEIFNKLLSLGAEVNVHDVAGFTPLHMCFFICNDVTIKMAEILLNKGADVNAKNRFGSTALMCLIMQNSKNISESNLENVSFLLDHGANPDIKNNDGATFRMFARECFPIMNLLGAADVKKSSIERKKIHAEAGGNFKQCKVCKSYNKDTKRCTGCYLEWYCSPNCQRVDWVSHKEDCKKIRKEYVSVTVHLETGVGINHLTGRTFSNVGKKNEPTKEHFVSKIQRGQYLGDNNDMVEVPMLKIYNKDKTFIGNIEKAGNEKAFKAISSIIREDGFRRLKGFFYTIYNSKKGVWAEGEAGALEVSINVLRMLPVENW